MFLQTRLVISITALWLAQLLFRLMARLAYLVSLLMWGRVGDSLVWFTRECDNRVLALLGGMIEKRMQALRSRQAAHFDPSTPWFKRASTLHLIGVLVVGAFGVVPSVLLMLAGVCCYPVLWVLQRPTGAYSIDPYLSDPEPDGPGIRWLLYWIGAIPECVVGIVTWGGVIIAGACARWAKEAIEEIDARIRASFNFKISTFFPIG